jgi:four helix bundle protein
MGWDDRIRVVLKQKREPAGVTKLGTSSSRGSTSYEDLVAWQRAMELVDAVYQATSRWPSDERFGLTSQIRRAAVSIAANIAEGQGRNGRREFLHHLGIANGSVCEVETMIRIATRQGYHIPDAETVVLATAREVSRLVNGLIRALQNSDQSRLETRN